MTKLAMVGLVAVLAQAVPVEKCGSVTVDGPKTEACPKGVYLVTVDRSVTPPHVSQVCKEPATPESPGPSPSAAPSASPTAPPSATPPPTPPPTTTTTTLPPSPPPVVDEGFVACPAFPNLRCPIENTCPASWDHRATRVGIGDKPAVASTSKRARIQVFLSSKDQPPYCAHRGNFGECEQWSACAAQQDKKGFPPRVWFAAYPGTACDMGSGNVNDCQIEHPSRSCDADEKAEDERNGQDPSRCARPNGFTLVDIVGEGGGPAGVRKICALPPAYDRRLRQAHPFNYAEWTRTRRGGFKRKTTGTRTEGAKMLGAEEATCRSWEFTLGGARLIE